MRKIIRRICKGDVTGGNPFSPEEGEGIATKDVGPLSETAFLQIFFKNRDVRGILFYKDPLGGSGAQCLYADSAASGKKI